VKRISVTGLQTVIFLLSFSCSAFAIEDLLRDYAQVSKDIAATVFHSKETDPLYKDIFYARNMRVKKINILQVVFNAAEKDIGVGANKLTHTTNKVLDFLSRNQKELGPALVFFEDMVDGLRHFESEERGHIENKNLSELNSLLEAIDILKSANVSGGKLEKKKSDWNNYLGALAGKSLEEADLEFQLDSVRGFDDRAVYHKDSLSDSEPKVIWGNELPDKNLVLTFDDGPHYKYTGRILDILKVSNIKAYFFVVGKNVGKVLAPEDFNKVYVRLEKKFGKRAGLTETNGRNFDAALVQSTITYRKNRGVLERVINEGHELGNHSYSHSVLTKEEAYARDLEVWKTNKLIEGIIGTRTKYFRPPYGATNFSLRNSVDELDLVSVMWTIDSLDWSAPSPQLIVDKVIERCEKLGKGIILFHDIHSQTVEALPLIIKELKLRGFKFTSL
jgi:peptidoglycan/xylan/chitin deacetylase (PgdA/CDA1 family)